MNKGVVVKTSDSIKIFKKSDVHDFKKAIIECACKLIDSKRKRSEFKKELSFLFNKYIK